LQSFAGADAPPSRRGRRRAEGPAATRSACLQAKRVAARPAGIPDAATAQDRARAFLVVTSPEHSPARAPL